MAEDGTTVDPVESTEPAEPATPAGGEGNPTDPAPAATAQATDATEPTADMPSLLGEGGSNDGDQKPAQAAPEAYEPFDVEGQQFNRSSARRLCRYGEGARALAGKCPEDACRHGPHGAPVFWWMT